MKYFLLLISTIIFSTLASAQNKYWVQLIKYSDVQEGKGIIVEPDHYILIGSHGNYPDFLWQGYITRFDFQGNVIDNKDYQNLNGKFVFQSIKQSEWGYYCTGYHYTPTPVEIQQPILLQYNTLTETESLVMVGTETLKPSGRAITMNNNSDFIIVGIAVDTTTAAWQPYAIKIDSLGNVIWEQVYDNYPLLNWLTDIVPVPNEAAYYVLGTVGYNVSQSDILLAKISDATGEMLWDTIYDFGPTYWDYDGKDLGGRMIRSINGGYIAGALTNGFGDAYYKGTIIKFNDSFDIVWYIDHILYNCGPATVNELENGDIITSGCNDPLGEYAQMQIIKLSGIDGIIKWRRTYGGSRHDYAYDLALAPNGGFIVAGRQDTIIPGAPVGHASAWLLKLNCMGLLTEPLAAYSYEPIGDNQIMFTNQTLYAYPDSIDGGYYRWDWGDDSPPYICGQGYEPCTGNILTHQYPSPGTYTATLTAIVCSDTSAIQAQIDTEGGGGTVSISDSFTSWEGSGVGSSVHVYPNPAQNTLTFARNNVLTPPSGGRGVTGDLGVTLYNLTGQLVLQTTLVSAGSTNPAGETVKTISVAHLPVGIYLYVAEQAGSVLARGKVAVVR